jgi:hypothetical protein
MGADASTPDPPFLRLSFMNHHAAGDQSRAWKWGARRIREWSIRHISSLFSREQGRSSETHEQANSHTQSSGAPLHEESSPTSRPSPSVPVVERRIFEHTREFVPYTIFRSNKGIYESIRLWIPYIPGSDERLQVGTGQSPNDGLARLDQLRQDPQTFIDSAQNETHLRFTLWPEMKSTLPSECILCMEFFVWLLLSIPHYVQWYQNLDRDPAEETRFDAEKRQLALKQSDWPSKHPPQRRMLTTKERDFLWGRQARVEENGQAG